MKIAYNSYTLDAGLASTICNWKIEQHFYNSTKIRKTETLQKVRTKGAAAVRYCPSQVRQKWLKNEITEIF